MTDTTDIVRRHVEAVTAMLLGARILQPGAMIVAGELTGADGPIALGRLTTAMGRDIVFLAFGDTADGYHLTDVAVVAMRAGICHVQMGCRLYLPKSGTRAVILPQSRVRGVFRLSPDELLQIDRKPADIEDGVARAAARLATLVERGVALDGRAVINTCPLVA